MPRIRRRNLRRRFVWVGMLALGLAGASHWAMSRVRSDLGRALGFAAQVTCSGVFVSLRSTDAVRSEFPPHPLTSIIALDLPDDESAVVAYLPGPLRRMGTRISVYEPDRGCTLIPPQASPAEWRRSREATGVGRGIVRCAPEASGGFQLAIVASASPEGPSPTPTPPSALENALQFAFEPHGIDGLPVRTRAVLVLQDTTVLGERYAPGITAATPLPGWSMAKTVTHALVGILLADGHGGWTDPASIRGVLPEYWPDGDARRDISLEDLLRMRSGLRFGEDYGGLGSDANRMLWGEGDVVDYAASVPLAHPPGSVWSYSSGSTNLLAAWLHARVAERGGDLRDLARSQLFGPTGMISAVFESDARGTLVASSLVHATARDWARLGLLYLNDGWVEGPRGRVQVLPSGWTRHGRTPTPEAPFGQYGAQIWLNAGVDDTGAGRPWPSLPPDLFVARGYQGQVMAVFPSERLVVVRLGADGEGTGWDLEAFLYTVWQGARTNDVEGAGSSVHAPENEPTREGQS